MTDGAYEQLMEDLRKEVAPNWDDMDLNATTLNTDTVSIAEQEQLRIDRAVRGAIRAGYDGVDINYPGMGDLARRPLSEVSFGPESIVPWDRPAPDGANGYRTERYTWDWFSDDELARILTDDDLVQELAAAMRGSDE